MSHAAELERQDEMLDELGQQIGRIKKIAQGIHQETDEQNTLLGELNDNVEHATTRVTNTTKK